MEPIMAVVVALCIFLGGLLPLLAHLIDYLQAKLLLSERETAAPETIANLTDRFETLLKRVEEASADVARTTLTARQIPTQIQSSTEAIDKSKTALTDALSCIEKLPTSTSIEALAEKLEPTMNAPVDLSPISTRLDALEAQVDKGLLIREDKLEEIIEHLQQLEETIDSAPEALSASEESAPPVEVPTEPASSPAKADEQTLPANKKKPTAKPKQAPAPSPQADLFSQASEETVLSNPSTTSIRAKAMVGLGNEVFARGDEPLSWEQGSPLKPVGIGEWLLELEDILGPIEVQLRLNDEVAANGPSLNLEPGQQIDATPEFPPENEPF